MKKTLFAILFFFVTSFIFAIPVDALWGTIFYSDFYSSNKKMNENSLYVSNHHSAEKNASKLEGFDYNSPETIYFHGSKIQYANNLYKDGYLVGCNVFMYMTSFEEFEKFLNDIFDTYTDITLVNQNVNEKIAEQTYSCVNGNVMYIRLEHKLDEIYYLMFSVAAPPKMQ